MSYVLRRSKCYETLIVPDEMAALSFHLRHNLWQASASTVPCSPKMPPPTCKPP